MHHVKLLVSAGAAAASLIAGTAGTAILVHATPAPQHKAVKPTPHHLSNAHHSSGTKGTGTGRNGKNGKNTGSVSHHHKSLNGKTGTHTGHHPQSSQNPRPTPPQPVQPTP